MFLFIIFLSSQLALMTDLPFETSLVLLLLSTEDDVLSSDPFFELLDMGDYILVPLNMLSAHLDLNVVFLREENQLLIENIHDGKMVMVDLENRQYVDHLEWSEQPPLIFEGDFYVSPLLIEEVAGVKIDWNPQYQELTIRGDFFEKEIKTEKKEEEIKKGEGEGEREQVIIGPNFSFGSIQYKISGERRKSEDGQDILKGRQKLFLHGRAGDWALSLGQEGNFDFFRDDEELSLPLIRAKNVENNRLIILGDSHFDLPETIGRVDLRGIFFKSPKIHRNKLIAYTSVFGKAEPGDSVFLFINEKLFDKLVITEGDSYYFKYIPLRLKRVNLIRVKIEKKDGETSEIIKKLVASPRILESGTKELLAVAGLYRDYDREQWEGRMIGLDLNQSLSENSSWAWEAVINDEEFKQESDNNTLCASDLGFAFRLGENLVMTLDWLVGGERDELEQGLKSSLLYGLEEGYLEYVYLFIPPEVTKGLQIESGQINELRGVWDLSEKWWLEACVKEKNYLLLPEEKSKMGFLTFAYRNNWQNFFAITGKRGETTAQIREIGFEGDEKINETGLILKSGMYRKGFNGEAKLDLLSADISREGIREDIKVETINLETDITKAFLKLLLLTNKLETSALWRNKKFFEETLNNQARLKWYLTDKTRVYLSGETEGIWNEETDYQFKEKKAKLTASAQYYLNRDNNIQLSLSLNRSESNDTYTSCDLGLDHFWKDRKGRVSFNLGYVSPVLYRTEPQWLGEIKLKHYLNSDLGLELKLERLYDSIFDDNPEYVIYLSLDQVLGFADRVIQGQRFSNGEHITFVGGIVYLDENGNGSFDDDEKRLKGIKISLDGRRAETDENGIFRFDFVRPDVYNLGFDLNSLEADYTPITEDRLIKIRENENMFFDFGLTMNGTISGRVFLDKNANGMMDDDDEPIQLVGFSLNNSAKKIYTDQNGGFYLENIPLGEHTLTLLDETLPQAMKALNDEIYLIKISEEVLDSKEILIPLVYQFVD